MNSSDSHETAYSLSDELDNLSKIIAQYGLTLSETVKYYCINYKPFCNF